MEKYVHVHLKGAKQAVVIRADTVEDDDVTTLTVKLGNNKVGEFKKAEVAGWSIHDLDED